MSICQPQLVCLFDYKNSRISPKIHKIRRFTMAVIHFSDFEVLEVGLVFNDDNSKDELVNNCNKKMYIHFPFPSKPNIIVVDSEPVFHTKLIV